MADNDQSKKNSTDKSDNDLFEKLEKKIIDNVEESTADGEELKELDINIKIDEKETKNPAFDDLNAQTDSQKKHEEETIEALEEYEGKIKKRQKDDEEYFKRYEKQRKEEAKSLEEWDGQDEEKDEKKEDEPGEGDENEYARNLHKDKLTAREKSPDIADDDTGQNQGQALTQLNEPNAGLMDKVRNRTDELIDKNLERADMLPVAGRHRRFKRNLENEKNIDQKKKLAVNRRKKIKETLRKPTTAGTAHLLKLAWLNLLDTFGLSLIYIDIHFIAKYLTPFGDSFCAFGEEWLPKINIVANSENKKGRTTKTGTIFLGLLEKMGCLALNLLLAGILFGILLLIYSIIEPIINPGATIKETAVGNIPYLLISPFSYLVKNFFDLYQKFNIN